MNKSEADEALRVYTARFEVDKIVHPAPALEYHRAMEADRDAYRVDRDPPMPEDSAESQCPFPKPGHCDKYLVSSGKYLRYDLFPFDVLQEIVEVLTFGEEKHVITKQGEGVTWRAGVPYSQRINKAMRHLIAFAFKKNKDEESGRHTLAHAIVQLMFLMGMDIRGCKYRGFDDRARLTGGKDER